MASGDQVTAFTIAQAPAATPTSTTLTASPNPANPGATVTLTATVSPAPDGGTVRFTLSGSAVSGCSAVAVSTATGGRAVCHTTFTQTGTLKLAAAYSGDSFYAASSSATVSESVINPPAITRVTLGPRRFKVTHATTLRLTLNKAATVTFAVTKLRSGHKVKGRCRVNARRGKKCQVRVTLTRRRLKSPAGRHKFKLAFLHLAPGRYTALIYATDRAGRRSRTVRITFTILSAGRR